MVFRSGIFLSTLICSFLQVIAAPEEKSLRSSEFLRQVEPGFRRLYELEYEAALELFERLSEEWPEHPGPPLYAASTVWLREMYVRSDLDLDKFLSPSYFTQKSGRKMTEEDRRCFKKHLDEADARCKRRLSVDPDDLEARYFQGAVAGIRAAFAITVERDVGDAIKYGKRAYQTHLELVEEDPTFYDAYMTVGLYEYIVDNLPWYIKWLAILAGYQGSKERGFEYLRLAGEQGVYVADDTKVIQMVLFVREKRYRDALRIARELHQRYPGNWLLHVNQAQILERMRETEQAARVYRQVLELQRQGRPHYDDIPLLPFLTQLGRKFRTFGDFETAQSFLHAALSASDVDPNERAEVHLETAKTFDLQGMREAALDHYRQVLELAREKDLRREAERYLKSPYTG